MGRRLKLQFNYSMTLNFEVGRDGMSALIREYHATSPTSKKALWYQRLTFPVVMLFFSADFYFRKKGGLPSLVFLIGGVIWFLLYPSIYRRRVRKNVEKYLAEMSTEKVMGPCQLELDEAGLSSRSPMGDSKYPWNVVQRITLTPDYLHVFLVGGSGFPIPRKTVGDSAIFEAKKLIKSKTNL